MAGMKPNYTLLPEHMREGMQRYIENGIEPGGFLMAILSNDFMLACMMADSINKHHLYDYAVFLYSEAPGDCYGSRENVRMWLMSKRCDHVFEGGSCAKCGAIP